MVENKAGHILIVSLFVLGACFVIAGSLWGDRIGAPRPAVTEPAPADASLPQEAKLK